MKKAMIPVTALISVLLLTACGITEEESNGAFAPESSTEQITEATAETTTENTQTETTAADTTSETTTTAVMNGAPDSDFVSIAGDWYIDGDPSAASIHIEPDGTFRAYYATGYLECEGSIRYESEIIEDTTIYWYMLYSGDGEFFTGFVDDESSVKTDLYAGNGGYPHYQKFTGAGGIADDGRGPGEEFVGTWECERASLEITQISDTEFHAVIHWSDSAFAHVEWDYPLTYENGTLVCSGKCTKTYVEYTSADTDPDRTVEYTDGSGEFTMQGAGVIWNDLTEHSGDNMVFSYIPEE